MVKLSVSEFKKLVLGGYDYIMAFSTDGKSKFNIRAHEFCVHEKEYLKSIIDFIGKWLLIKLSFWNIIKENK